MSSTGPIVGSFQIARAYGVQPRPAVRQSSPVHNTETAPQANEARPASRLVAGIVPGRVNFSGEQPTHDRSALAMYSNPADRNAAATGVSAGRLIDVNG